MQYLLSSKNNAIILAADADQKIMALHSFKSISYGLNQAADGIVCLVGGGRDVPVIHVIEKSLTNTCIGATPGVDKLLACTTANDVRTLLAPDADTAAANNYRGSATFCAAPWLAHSVMKARTHDPHELIPIAIDAALVFDNKHRGDSTHVSRAEDSVGDFVQWAWLIGGGGITKIEVCHHFSIDMNICIDAYRNEMESMCLGKEPKCWSIHDDVKLTGLFVNATVDPSNLAGVYIVWVL